MSVKKTKKSKVKKPLKKSVVSSSAKSSSDGRVPISHTLPPRLSPYVIRLESSESPRRERGPRLTSPAPVLQPSFADEGTDDGLARQLRENDIILDLPEVEADFVPARDELVELADILPRDIEPEIKSIVLEAKPIDLPTIARARRSVAVVRLKPHRALAVFTACAMLLVMPLTAVRSITQARAAATDIQSLSGAAIDDFSAGAQAFSTSDFAVAEDEFSRAAQKFSEAEDQLSSMQASLAAIASVIPSTRRTYASGQGLIGAGSELSAVAGILSDAAGTIAPSKATDVVTKLELLAEAMEAAAPHVDAAAEHLEAVDPEVVPAEYQVRVASLQEYVPRLSTAVHEFLTFANTLSTVLGGQGKMRYLVAFQNSTELRPTGGFVGSFAQMDIGHGVIEDMVIPGGGTYDVQGQLNKFVAAPAPLGLINARWELQDANWFPDFPSSARKIQWFYENAGGPTTDGVVAINSGLVVKLLEVLGPIDMPEYGKTIDAENFMFETQKIVEFDYDKVANKPKQFLADMAPKLLAKMTDADLPTFLQVLDVVGEALAEKDIQIYFRQNELQAAVNTLGWSGAMARPSGDYLMLVNTNLGGGKTDSIITQDAHLDVVIDEDGSIENTLTLTKTHHGMKNALLTGRNNVDYLRLYVPEGSAIVSASGFEAPPDTLFETSEVPLAIDPDLSAAVSDVYADPSGLDTWREGGKTVIGGWMQTAPGEVETISVTYRLPFSVAPLFTRDLFSSAKATLGFADMLPYTFFLQKQSGADTRQTTVQVHLPASLSAAWSSDTAILADGLTFTNAEDAVARLLLTHK